MTKARLYPALSTTLLASDLNRLLADAAAHLPSLRDARGTSADGRSVLELLFGEGVQSRPQPTGLVRVLAEAYGGDEAALGEALRRLSLLCAGFLGHFGDRPVRLLRAPARINILGEHVDYVSYLPTCSLPFGSREHDMLMLYGPSEAGRVRGASMHADYAPFDFSLEGGPPAVGGVSYVAAWLSYVFGGETPAPHWANYV